MRAWIARHPRLMFALSVALVALALSPVPQVIAQNFARVYVLDGAPGSPSYTFNNNTNRGLYNDTMNSAVAVAVGGAQVTRFVAGGQVVTGHYSAKNTATPTVYPGAGSSVSVTGSDQAAKITITGTPTSVYVAFATSWGAAPVCIAQNESRTGITYRFPTTAGGGTITGSGAVTSGDVVSFNCMGIS